MQATGRLTENTVRILALEHRHWSSVHELVRLWNSAGWLRGNSVGEEGGGGDVIVPSILQPETSRASARRV